MIRKIIAVFLILAGIGVASEGNVTSCIVAIVLAILIWPKSTKGTETQADVGEEKTFGGFSPKFPSGVCAPFDWIGCPTCGRGVELYDHFCPNCGSPLPSVSRICRRCSGIMWASSTHCIYCGSQEFLFTYNGPQPSAWQWNGTYAEGREPHLNEIIPNLAKNDSRKISYCPKCGSPSISVGDHLACSGCGFNAWITDWHA